jgi:hypothetical protein
MMTRRRTIVFDVSRKSQDPLLLDNQISDARTRKVVNQQPATLVGLEIEPTRAEGVHARRLSASAARERGPQRRLEKQRNIATSSTLCMCALFSAWHSQ